MAAIYKLLVPTAITDFLFIAFTPARSHVRRLAL